MAKSVVWKNIMVSPESSFGSSIGASYGVPVSSIDISNDPTHERKEDTSSSPHGHERAVYLRDSLEGSASINVDALSIRFWYDMLFSGGATVGNVDPEGGATAMTFIQDSAGSVKSYRVDIDRETSQDGYLGVVSGGHEMSASGDLVEASIDLMAKSEFSGVSQSPSGVTVTPFVFAESAIYIGDTVTGCTTEVDVDEWTASYNPNVEMAHQSGSREAKRVDGMIPTSEVNWTRFYDDTNYKTYVENGTEKALKIVLTSGDTYAGSSQYKVTWYIPRVQFSRSERSYSFGEFKKETVTGVALYSQNVGYLARSVVWNGLDSLT